MCIESGRPSTASTPIALTVNTNLQGDITGIRDTDIASKSLIIDNVSLSNPSGAVHAGDVDGDSDVAPMIDNDDTLGFTNIGYNFSGITVEPKTGDILGPVMDPIIDPNETYDLAVQSLIDDMMTGIRDVSGTAGPGGSTFRTDSYQDKAQLMQHAPKESEYRPESQVNPVGVGYTEVEWTYFADNIGGTGGTGGTTFRIENVAGFPCDSFGFESSTFDVMNVTLSPASNSEYA